jgi:(p)ppGpp synthase/HD superfamily hydrolase
MATLENALILATEAHRGMVDKGGVCYILHPLRLMNRMTTDDERLVALLHDVVEDSPWTLDGLRAEGFADNVVDAIDCLTRRNGESYENFIQRGAVNPLARRVKLADIEDNMDVKRLNGLKDSDLERLRRYQNARQVILAAMA